MARLCINIENITALRFLGKGAIPDPLTVVSYAEIGGADGIVCPLRDELRPVTERDARLLKEAVSTHLNLRIPLIEPMVDLAISIAPDMVTLTPSKTFKSTAGGGLDVASSIEDIAALTQKIREKELVVSMLIEPAIQQVKAAEKAGADYVEFHLGRYASSASLNERSEVLDNVRTQALAASKLGMGVSAGHGLTYQNITDIVSIEAVEELNVGHAIISRALWVGMEAAVRDMAVLVH